MSLVGLCLADALIAVFRSGPGGVGYADVNG
jgi:hypothetical protein